MAKYVITISETNHLDIVEVPREEEEQISIERIEESAGSFNMMDIGEGDAIIRVFVKNHKDCGNPFNPSEPFKGAALVCLGSNPVGRHTGIPMSFADVIPIYAMLKLRFLHNV